MIGIGIGIPIINRGISGTAPSNSVAPVVSGLNMVGETLTTTDGTWIGSTPQTLTRQFQRSTDGGTTWINVGSYVTQALNTWTALNASVGAGTTNPTFFSSNFKLTEDNTNNAHYISLPTGYMTATNTYSFSIVAKAAERDWVYVYIYDFPEGTGKGAWFNVSTGVIGTTESGITAQITNLGSGWFQCTVSRAVSGDSNDNGGIAVSTGDGVLTYTGTTGSGVFLTGAKVYTGNLSTYIPVSADSGNLVRSFVYSTNSIGVASSASSNSISIVSMDLINLQSYDSSKFTLSGSKITAWTEQNGTTQWTQSTDSLRPTLTSGVPTFGGNGITLLRATDVSATVFSLYFVVRNVGENFDRSLFASITGTNWFNMGNSAYTNSINVSGSGKWSGYGGYRGKRDIVFSIRRDGNTFNVYINNRVIIQITNTFAGEATLIGRLMSLASFNTFAMNGTLKSVCMSSTYLSESVHQDVINSLYDKYNLDSNTAIDTIIGFGDSNTRGTGSTSYLVGLASQFGLGYTNNGIPSSMLTAYNANSAIARYQSQVQTRPYRDYLVSMFGTNDINISNVSPSVFKSTYQTILTDLITTKGWTASRICLVTPPYMRDNVKESELNAYRTVIIELVAEYGTKYFDLLQDMRDNGGNSLLGDVTHLNQTGQNRLQAGVYAALTS